MKSALAHKALIDCGYELIFIDQLSLFYHHNIHRGWVFKNLSSQIIIKIESFSMSFIIAASEHKFYDIMGNQDANDHQIFIHFLCEFLEAKLDPDIDDFSKFLLVVDNASIHRTREFQEFSSKHRIKLLTIPLYSPFLNAAEYFIQSIKTKIKRNQRFGR